jgi:hypothetical protein
MVEQIYSLEFLFVAARMISMVLVTSNKSKQLLRVSYIGQVRPEQIQSSHEDLKAQLEELSPGYRLLADLSDLESMELECVPVLGRVMDMIGASGVNLVVRVIPDPSKDIGLNIMRIFHYPHHLQVVTCKNIIEAVRALEL